MTRSTRRGLLAGATLALTAPAYFRQARAADSKPINVGSLPPLSGSGATYGANIADAHRKVVEAVNKAGGIYGSPVNLVIEDSETDPDAAVRAARKLIYVNQVNAILGTWASSVTIGIMPMAQQANVLQFCTSSSDSIPLGDKKGLVFDFQPLNNDWGTGLARLAILKGYKNIAFCGPNNDFATSIVKSFSQSLVAAGGKIVGTPFFYDPKQISFRADAERIINENPPAIFIAGYVNDFTSLYRELIQGGYQGQVFAISFAVGPQFKKAVGQAADGVMHGFPVPPVGKDSYDAYLRFVGVQPNGQVQNPFGCAAYDEINVLLLAIASQRIAKTGTLSQHVMKVANGPGQRVTTYAEGASLLATGKPINYDGASSPVDFKPNGMLESRDFELYQIKDGKDVPLLRITSKA